MKWYFLILSFLFVSVNLSAQNTNCKPADCAKICEKIPNCTPADCAKICASHPSCKPAPSCNPNGKAAANTSSAATNPLFMAPLDQLAQKAAMNEEQTTTKTVKKTCQPSSCKGLKAAKVSEEAKAVKVAKKDGC